MNKLDLLISGKPELLNILKQLIVTDMVCTFFVLKSVAPMYLMSEEPREMLYAGRKVIHNI